MTRRTTPRSCPDSAMAREGWPELRFEEIGPETAKAYLLKHLSWRAVEGFPEIS